MVRRHEHGKAYTYSFIVEFDKQRVVNYPPATGEELFYFQAALLFDRPYAQPQ